MINKQDLQKIETRDNERYGGRLEKLGDDIHTLGWDTKENQYKRFESAVSILDLEGKDIVDIGCGFADFYVFLKEKGIKVGSYTGIDINEGLIKVAKGKYPDGKFICQNMLLDPIKEEFDVGFAFGILNFNLKGNPDNYEYAKDFIKTGFSFCKTFVVDMLSSHIDKSYIPEDFVFYYSPEKMLEYAFSLTNNIILKHDYDAIPQKELTLYLKR